MGVLHPLSLSQLLTHLVPQSNDILCANIFWHNLCQNMTPGGVRDMAAGWLLPPRHKKESFSTSSNSLIHHMFLQAFCIEQLLE